MTEFQSEISFGIGCPFRSQPGTLDAYEKPDALAASQRQLQLGAKVFHLLLLRGEHDGHG